jgi:hypothetical protein
MNLFFTDELLQCFGALIVETLEAGTQTGGAKFGMEGLKSGKDGGAHAVLDWFDEYAGAVIIIDNDQIIVASAGWGGNRLVRLLKICPVGSRRAA